MELKQGAYYPATAETLDALEVGDGFQWISNGGVVWNLWKTADGVEVTPSGKTARMEVAHQGRERRFQFGFRDADRVRTAP